MKYIALSTAIFSVIGMKTAVAMPVNASAGLNISNSLLIAGGGPLPLGLEVRTLDPLSLELSQDSSLDAPDTVPFEDSLTVIAGLTVDDPSRFFRVDSSTRNGGTEGAVASNNHRLYQIREADQDGTSDVSERGVWGESSSQALLTTGFYEASANANVFNQRQFAITNENATALTFGIQGVFEIDMFALANGMNTFAQSTATGGLWFTSSNILDIQFSDIEPYVFDEDGFGPNTVASISRETDVAGTGYLSMTANTSAFNSGAINGDAFATGRMSYAIGITLQPGEEIIMAHAMSYSTMAEISNEPIRVTTPGSMALLSIALFGLVRIRKGTDNLTF